jgi:3-phenylpropionate/trans-cinnamate dioxygenase ferredoxin reductase component
LRSTALPRLRVLDEETARVFAELHTVHGVDLRMGAGVSEIHGDGARVSSVTLSDGDTVPADAVVAGVGIRPAVELAEVAGLSVDNDVLVNAALRTSDPTSPPLATSPTRHPLGRRIRVEHWANALPGGPPLSGHARP